jgi:hypothetical protein
MTEPHNPEPAPDEQPSTTAVLLDLLKHRFLSVVGVLLLAGGLGAYFGIAPSVPRWLKLALTVGLLVSPSGLWAAKYIIKLLPDPHMVFLVDVDAREPDGALYQFPAREFSELTVTEDELHQASPSLYFGKEVNLEEMTVKGTWRGTLSDRELLTAVSKIDECRGTLEDDAKRGFTIETQAWSIIRNATRSAVRSVVATFERGTLPDGGEGLGREIDRALEDFDLDQDIRHVEGDDGTPDHDPTDAPDDLDADPLDEDTQQPQPEVSADD